MVKEWIIGSGIATALFLVYLGVNPLPLVIILAVLIGVLYMEKPSSLKGKKSSFVTSAQIPNVKFEDIGGQDRAKKELQEALDFLIHRDRLHHYGIRPIKGILLSGPPGTGKTLMAKAAANYTQSVFVSASGSQFVEKYVGIGAQRIRDLFQEARELARKSGTKSAIVFIDEIDVIGGKREGSQHKEYDQTLNQLLTEMDGISGDQGIHLLVIAATNRKDMLDSALLRPGRFDRHIVVDLPDKKGRKKILELHLRNKPLAPDVNLDRLAVETFGFSGAQLESVTNEAAIYAMREQLEHITQRHLSQAIDKVMMGEKTDRETTREEKERVAIHELGHAVIAEMVRPGSVSRVALSPRGQALGYVRHHPEPDRYLYTKKQLEDQIRICLAGAAAEQLFYENKSTGAHNDYEQARKYARTIVETGMSRLGLIDPQLISKEKVHEEISRLLNDLFEETYECLKTARSLFEPCLHILLKEETLSGEQFRDLVEKFLRNPATI
jgi:cell division protease FtsH